MDFYNSGSISLECLVILFVSGHDLVAQLTTPPTHLLVLHIGLYTRLFFPISDTVIKGDFAANSMLVTKFPC